MLSPPEDLDLIDVRKGDVRKGGTPSVEGYAPPKYFSLVFIIDRERDKILLGRKKRGFGIGIINGFGGKPNVGEDIASCAIRETFEECGLRIDPQNLEDIGEISVVRHDEKIIEVLRIFSTSTWDGEVIDSDEMEPRWVDIPDIPYKDMWPEASVHLPAILSEPRPLSRRLVGRIDVDGTETGWWMGWTASAMLRPKHA